MLLSVIGGVIYTIASPPGREKTDVVKIDEDQKDELKSAHTDRLSAKWDSDCLLYTSPSPRDGLLSRMPSSA